MSGTNRQVVSSIIGKGGSESALTKALENANEEALKENKEVSKDK